MTYAIGDAVEGPAPCGGCRQSVAVVFAEGADYTGRMAWRCAACYAPAIQQAAGLDEKPVTVVDCRQTKSARAGQKAGGVQMAQDKAPATITMTRSKATKNGYRYDSTSSAVRGSLYLDAAASKGVMALSVTVAPAKAS